MTTLKISTALSGTSFTLAAAADGAGVDTVQSRQSWKQGERLRDFPPQLGFQVRLRIGSRCPERERPVESSLASYFAFIVRVAILLR
jgi:hypothetical protein